ncbi:MAG TPA: DNA translocase FtsK 4TM domain-containing protein [Acidimicrobiia bacterium]|nr:DNA translocase FtsK 4TM domain-containing protein [Acidimicrobiia bacterium]
MAAPPRTRRRKSASKRGRTSRRRAPARPSAWERTREAAGHQLGGHGADALAVALVVVGVLTVLGLASDLAGSVGSFLADGSATMLGRGRIAFPLACFGFAGLLVAGYLPHHVGADDADDEGADDEEGDARSPAPLRVGLGIVLAMLAVVGLLHLAGGRPSVDASDQLRNAGGLLGAAMAAPLASVAGVVGTAVILTGIGLLGLLLAPGVPMRRVFAAIGTGLRRVAGVVGDLFQLGGDHPAGDATAEELEEQAGAEEPDEDDLEDAADDVEPEPYEELAEADPEPPAPAPVRTTVEADGQVAIDLGSGYRPGSWKLPPANVLKRGTKHEIDRRFVEEGGKVLEAALAEFGVVAKLSGMTVGPTVTRYELELGSGVKVNRVTGLSHDIAYAMASPDVRILAPIPGRSAIGVEVPNRQRQLVTLGDLLATEEAKQPSHPLEVALGRDISGQPVMLNLTTMPHLLIAGATGAGKSSCINSIVSSILMRATPDQVRLILVDPKRVELGGYNDLPHLLTPVVTNPKKAANALDWAVREMDLRYELLADAGVRDIAGYNAAFDRGDLATTEEPDPMTGRGFERLPYILVVVDELNDLMMVAARDVEASVCRIAQMARAVGIHLVIATQRPSVDVITGVIKANIPSRLAFSVTSIADSRVILDQAGADKLIGQGDMLLVSASSSRPQRIQGAWVDEECIHRLVAHWRRQHPQPDYVEGIAGEEGGGGRSGGEVDEDDELLAEAMELVVRSGLGSTSMLQRKLRVGFARAGRLMDLLERRGVVGPSEGSKARAVLMTVEEYEELEQRV